MTCVVCCDSIYRMKDVSNLNPLMCMSCEDMPIPEKFPDPPEPTEEDYLVEFGFSGIQFTSEYAFKCDQVGKTCPCCGNTHSRHGYYINIHKPTGDMYVRHFSTKCVSKRIHKAERIRLAPFSFVL